MRSLELTAGYLTAHRAAPRCAALLLNPRAVRGEAVKARPCSSGSGRNTRMVSAAAIHTAADRDGPIEQSMRLAGGSVRYIYVHITPPAPEQCFLLLGL